MTPRLIHTRPERIDEIAAMNPHDAAAAIRELLGASPLGVACPSCHVRYVVWGDLTAAAGCQCPECGDGSLELAA